MQNAHYFSLGDGFTCRGSNYYVYNKGSTLKPKFVLIPHDFDDSMGTKGTMNLTAWAHVDLLKWGEAGICNDKASFLNRLAIFTFEKQYVAHIRLLLERVWLPIDQRLTALYELYAPSISLDLSYTLDWDQNLDAWYATRAFHWDQYLRERKASALKQLAMKL